MEKINQFELYNVLFLRSSAKLFENISKNKKIQNKIKKNKDLLFLKDKTKFMKKDFKTINEMYKTIKQGKGLDFQNKKIAIGLSEKYIYEINELKEELYYSYKYSEPQEYIFYAKILLQFIKNYLNYSLETDFYNKLSQYKEEIEYFKEIEKDLEILEKTSKNEDYHIYNRILSQSLIQFILDSVETITNKNILNGYKNSMKN